MHLVFGPDVTERQTHLSLVMVADKHFSIKLFVLGSAWLREIGFLSSEHHISIVGGEVLL